jgi:hypothetical protein
VATTWTVCPIVKDAELIVRLTVATGSGGTVTLSGCDPDFPSLVATIAAVPPPTAVTSPDADTVATLVLELDHVMVASAIAPPLPSSAIATACVV